MFAIAAESHDNDNFENFIEITAGLCSYLNTFFKNPCLRDYKEIAREVLVMELLTFNSPKVSHCMH